MACFVSFTSSSPSGAPCELEESCLFGLYLAIFRLGDNERWFVHLCLRRSQRLSDGFQVVPIDVLDMPAVGRETFADVFGESQVGRTIDGDAVAVVEVDELTQLQMAGERCCFGSNAFHHVAIATDAVAVVIDDWVVGAMK